MASKTQTTPAPRKRAAAKPKRHHEVTGGKRGPSPKWLDHYTAKRKARGDKPAEIAKWRKEQIAKYPTLRAHGLKK